MPSNPNTSNVWDIAEFVEGHPDNHDQRWRLAKKLYMAAEYRLALEHLQILRNEWQDHANVWRFLAATYYRLSRYTEAVHELRTALERWPEEIGLHEQYAKSLDRAGDGIGAAKAWEKVASMNPGHPFAAKAARKLRKRDEGAAEEQHAQRFAAIGGGPMMGPAGTGMPVVSTPREQVTCPNCGSRNGTDYERCWSCLAPLTAPQAAANPAGFVALPSERLAPMVGPVIVSLLAVAAGMRIYGRFANLPRAEGGLYESAAALLSAETFFVQLSICGVALLAWPLGLRLGLMVVDADDAITRRAYVAGLGLAFLTCATLQWPSQLFFVLLGIPLLASLAVVMLWFGLSRRDGAIVWAIQTGLVALAGVTVAVAFMGPSFVLEFPAVHRAASVISEPREASIDGATTFEARLTLDSTGSAWLDARAGTVEIVVNAAQSEERTFFEVLQGSRTVHFVQVDRAAFSLVADDIEAGTNYVVRLSNEGRDPIRGSVVVRSLLRPGLAGI